MESYIDEHKSGSRHVVYTIQPPSDGGTETGDRSQEEQKKDGGKESVCGDEQDRANCVHRPNPSDSIA